MTSLTICPDQLSFSEHWGLIKASARPADPSSPTSDLTRLDCFPGSRVKIVLRLPSAGLYQWR